MAWSVETLNSIVDAELEELPVDMLARFRYISQLIEEFGLERVREAHVKHLRGALWEMRLERERWNLAGTLCHCSRPPRRGSPRVQQENSEDAQSRNRTGPTTSKGNCAMTKVSTLHKKWMKNK